VKNMGQRMFNEKYLTGIPEQPLLALIRVCKDMQAFHSASATDSERIEKHDVYLEALGLIDVLAAKSGIVFQAPEIAKLPIKNIHNIIRYCVELDEVAQYHLARLKVQLAHARYEQLFGVGYSYVLAGEDVEQARSLLSELKRLIEATTLLDDGFKQRLLKRLEKLHFKVHLKMRSLDRFWGLLGDAGVVMSMAGDEAKPIVEKIARLTNLTWEIQARNERLATDAPQPEYLNSKLNTFLGALIK